MAQFHWLSTKVGNCLLLFCIHRVNSRNGSESWWQHHKPCPVIIIIILIIVTTCQLINAVILSTTERNFKLTFFYTGNHATAKVHNKYKTKFELPVVSWCNMAMYCFYHLTVSADLTVRGVDPYGTGGMRPPPIFGLGGQYYECPPQYFKSNIGYFSSM